MRVKVARGLRVRWRIGIRAHLDIGGLFGPAQQAGKGIIQCGFAHLSGPGQHLSAGAIHGDLIACAKHPAILRSDLHFAQVKPHVRGPHDTRQAKPTANHSRMAGDAAPFGQHRVGGVHATDIFGRGFAAHKDTQLTTCGTCLCFGGGKNDPSGGSTGAGGDALPDHVTGGIGINLTVQQLRQCARLNPHQGLLLGDDLVSGKGHRNAHRRLR